MADTSNGLFSGALSASLPSIMFLMLISGALNTLLMKFMVMQEVPTGVGNKPAGFDHPYFQTFLMMIGESLCLLAFYGTSSKETVEKSNAAPNKIFMVACAFDWTATTLVNMAYMVVPASVVQMTRGAVVIFTCLLSVFCLGRRQHNFHIVGVALVFLGITLVSVSTLFNPIHLDEQAAATQPGVPAGARMFGIFLCVAAQVFQASMLVYEENIMSQYDIPPLRVVGMEGLCGLVFGAFLLLGLNVFDVESTPAAMYQMKHSQPLLAAVVASIASIAVFNFAGVTVTQQASAVARSTMDVSRTILIWAVELAFGWNSFNSLQLLGFVSVALGTMVYNRLIVFDALEPADEAKTLIPSGPPLLPEAPAAAAQLPQQP